MTPVAIIREASADGVTLLLSSTGTVKVNGDEVTVNRWLALIRKNKAAIVAALAADLMTAEQEAAICAWLTYINETDPEIIRDVLDKCRADPDALVYFLKRSDEVPKPVRDPDDDRRLCTQCTNLSPRGRCLAAQRGEINRIPKFETIPNKLQYCIGYAPGPDDSDRRPGSERWQELNQRRGE